MGLSMSILCDRVYLINYVNGTALVNMIDQQDRRYVRYYHYILVCMTLTAFLII